MWGFSWPCMRIAEEMGAGGAWGGGGGVKELGSVDSGVFVVYHGVSREEESIVIALFNTRTEGGVQ